MTSCYNSLHFNQSQPIRIKYNAGSGVMESIAAARCWMFDTYGISYLEGSREKGTVTLNLVPWANVISVSQIVTG